MMFTTRGAILASLACLTLAALTIDRMRRRGPSPASGDVSSAPTLDPTQSLRDEIRAAAKRASTSGSRAVDQVRQLSRWRARWQLLQAREGVDVMLDQLTSWPASLTLGHEMITDSLAGTSQATRRIQRSLEHHVALPVFMAAATAQAQHRDLSATLAMAEAQMAMQLAARAGGQEHRQAGQGQLLSAGLVDDAEPLVVASVSTIASTTSTGIFSLGLTALSARQIVSGAGRLLRPVAARAKLRFASGAAIAAADGPLPVADLAALLLELGFVAWAVHDLYQAQVQFKAHLRASLMRQIDDHEQRLLSWLSREASAYLVRHQARVDRMAASLLASLHTRER